jgi:hypothetical protein
VNGLPGGRPARDPDSRHQPEPTEHPCLFVVGDYLFDSTINGLLDSADVVVEWILEELAEGDSVPANGTAPAGEAAGHAKNGNPPALASPLPLPQPGYLVQQGKAS